MAGDDLDELHAMANELGLKREWFQDKRLPHYDVCQQKKSMAISKGAQSVTSRELIRIFRKTGE